MCSNWRPNIELKYRDKKLQQQCENYGKAKKELGKLRAEKLHQRINEMESIPNINIMISTRLGRCHRLSGDRKDQYAVDLDHPFRLIFELFDDKIEIVELLEIVDYH